MTSCNDRPTSGLSDIYGLDSGSYTLSGWVKTLGLPSLTLAGVMGCPAELLVRGDLFNDYKMSPRSASRAPRPAALALATRLAATIGATIRDERHRRSWTTRDLGSRARVASATVVGIEAGRRASLDVYSRLAVALGLSLDLNIGAAHARGTRARSDLVHAAMGELEASMLARFDYGLAVDHPYQHYQFAGRADVLAWSLEPPALLHIENRARFPDLQEAAGSFNAKCQYLAPVVARQLGIRRFESQTHVMVGLWSSEVIHSVRIRRATFGALCPDTGERMVAWMADAPPATGTVARWPSWTRSRAGVSERSSGSMRCCTG